MADVVGNIGARSLRKRMRLARQLKRGTTTATVHPTKSHTRGRISGVSPDKDQRRNSYFDGAMDLWKRLVGPKTHMKQRVGSSRKT